jgi:hypothetical protein
MSLIVSTAAAADKDKEKRFTVGPASSYASHQEFQKLRVAAVPLVTDEETRPPFGKLNPQKYGVLPVLLVFDNATGKALKLNLEVHYVTPEGDQIEATPARDVPYLQGPKARRDAGPVQVPLPLPIPRGQKKSPLLIPEIEGYAFAAKLLPPGESVHGFVYFQTPFQPGAKILINGIFEAATGKEFFFIEMPLEKQPAK